MQKRLEMHIEYDSICNIVDIFGYLDMLICGHAEICDICGYVRIYPEISGYMRVYADMRIYADLLGIMSPYRTFVRLDLCPPGLLSAGLLSAWTFARLDFCPHGLLFS